MRFLGYEDKTVRILDTLYEGTMSAVRVNRNFSERFETVVDILP